MTKTMSHCPIYGPAVEDLPTHALAGVVAAVVGHKVEALEANTLAQPLPTTEGRPVIMLVMHMLDKALITLTPPLVERRVFMRVMERVEEMKNHRLTLHHNQYLVPQGVVLEPAVAEADEAEELEMDLE